ncbi:LOW QUALITY PROTEIN: E3 ubiquitin-protein ligase RNF8-like, partial [Phymastichus coffea]|uniref:LOW QUALITY PROTEIN: E3 ubiquitin-protein ligase RNF8-like n=1 Tax=Phymastichus coffea TaxID=108790 RepID=UPI00273B8C2A
MEVDSTNSESSTINPTLMSVESAVVENCNIDKSIESQTSTIPTETSSSSKLSVGESSKKRTIKENVMPVLIRICSNEPSCGSDIIYINKDQFKIGRKPDNDEVILSVLISREHCILQYNENNDMWLVTNLSSTDTLLNNHPIPRNTTKIIHEGDVLQFSMSDCFRYKFSYIKQEPKCQKHPRMENSDLKLDNIINKQKTFVEWQKNERKDLEKQLADKQEDQEKLKQELEKLLEDQNVTKTCNKELNSQIEKLQKQIESGNSVELELQQQFKDLVKKSEEERLKFEKKLAEEKQKWQEALTITIEEKEKLELSMVEQMEELREKIEKIQQQEWQKKMDTLLHKEKNVQTKLQSEKQLLEQKLKEMEETLKKKEEQAQKSEIVVLAVNPSAMDMTNVGFMVELDSVRNVNDLPILETIDLTDTTDTPCLSYKNEKEETVIDKVNNIMDENLTCSICSELLVKAMTLNCSHTFCWFCIDSWIKRKRECPNCRSTVISLTRSLVVDNFIEKMVESLTPEQIEKRRKLIEE